MVTKKDYTKAIQVLEAYQKQLLYLAKKKKTANNNKTLITNWKNFHKCSGRLQNILVRMQIYDSELKETLKIIYIEDINKEMFFKLKHAGSKSWREFIKLRDN